MRRSFDERSRWKEYGTSTIRALKRRRMIESDGGKCRVKNAFSITVHGKGHSGVSIEGKECQREMKYIIWYDCLSEGSWDIVT